MTGSHAVLRQASAGRRAPAIGALACAALLAAQARPALAGEYSNDFASNVGIATAYGTAIVTGGRLRLTSSQVNQNSAMVLGDSAEGTISFTASFTYTFLDPTPPRKAAEGMSVNLGVLPSGVIPLNAENGPGNGLTISFDLFDFNSDGVVTSDRGIRVWSAGVVIASVPGAIDATDAGQPRAVTLRLDADGTLDVTYKGNAIVTDLQTGFVPQAGQRFGLAARTGAEFAEQRIDDLSIIWNDANDDLRQSLTIGALDEGHGGGPVRFGWNLASATTDGVSNPACSHGSSSDIARDLWYCWMAPANGYATISTVGLTTLDTRLAVYNGCAGAESFGILACNDDAPNPSGSGGLVSQSSVTFAITKGATYSIRLGVTPPGTAIGSNPSGRFEITLTPPDPPSHPLDPCVADINQTGLIDPDDLFEYLDTWFAGVGSTCP